MTSAKTVRHRRAQRGSGEQLRAEIGVTSPSLDLHFADKDALLSAVVADVFRELDDAMVAAGAAETTPLSRLHAFGMAYIRFAVDHPEHYRLALLDPCANPHAEVDPVLASSAFAHFNATVVGCIAAGMLCAAALGHAARGTFAEPPTPDDVVSWLAAQP